MTGSFTLKTRARRSLRKRLLLAAASGLVLPLSAFADTTAAKAAADSGDTVIVTGLRASSRRTVADSPAPVDVIGAAQLTDTGKEGLKEVLNSLVPSFDLPGINGGGTSWTVRAYTLRGLNGDDALFLVNGVRRHTTSLINNLSLVGNGGTPADLDLIPTSAIDHIEVLRDGAAAQYGSDAIAGVVNIILKHNLEGGSASATYGQTYIGDGATTNVNLNFAHPLGGNGGFIDTALDVKNSEPATRQVPSANKHLPAGDAYVFGDSYGSGQETLIDSSYNLEAPLNNGLTLYSFTTLSTRNSRKNTGSFLPDFAGASYINSLPQVYPNGFDALRRIFETDIQATFGLKGKTADWDWNLATSVSRDRAKLNGENTLNASLGPASPNVFHLATQQFEQWTTTLDATRQFEVGLAKPLALSWGLEHRWEQYSTAAGDLASYEVGDYVIPAGEPGAGKFPAPGLASYTGTSPADAGSANRNNDAAHVDLDANLTSKWYVGLAGRYEQYSDSAGDTASGKLSTRYEFLPGYAIRGAVSNGFRAPSLAQEVFASSTFSGVPVTVGGVTQEDIFPTKFLPANSAAAEALGATPLRPETSENYSAGFTAEPVKHLLITLDAYQIDIKNRIVATSNLSLTAAQLASSPALSPLLTRFPEGFAAQYFTNAVATRTGGFDFVTDYEVNLSQWGRLDLNAAYTYNRTYITHINATPSQLAGYGLTLFDRQKQANLTEATPRDKVILGADWRIGAFKVNFHETRYGQYTEVNNAAVVSLDRTFSPKWITDLDISYRVNPQTSVAIGANNLFDVYPDKIGVVSADLGTGQFGNDSPFGITGGYYYVRIGYSF